MTASASPQPKFHDAVYTILEQAWQPLHVNELTKRLLESGLWSSDAKTPAATVGAKLYTDIKQKGSQSQFVQAGRATFALNPNVAAPAPEETATTEEAGEAAAEEDAETGPVTPDSAPDATGLRKPLSFTDAAEDVLRRHADGKPMHYRDITEKVLEENLVTTSGKTPEATPYAQMIQETARDESRRQADALRPSRQGARRAQRVAGTRSSHGDRQAQRCRGGGDAQAAPRARVRPA
jgi:restriction system protein